MYKRQIEYKKITFSDKKRFVLDGPDGNRFFWVHESEIQPFFGKKVFSQGIMVWGAIGYNGTTDNCVTTESIISEKYISIIESTYLPNHQPGYILMQDNARPHVSRQKLDFMERKEYSCLIGLLVLLTIT